MRFLVDECTGPAVAAWLGSQGYNVASIHDDSPGVSDLEVLRRAVHESRILVTNDKDFGEWAYRAGLEHHGIVLLRLDDERTGNKIRVLESVLKQFASELPARFVVVTDTHIRFGSQ